MHELRVDNQRLVGLVRARFGMMEDSVLGE